MFDTFHLKIQERGGILYEGEVTSLTSFNDSGEFDILAGHANFISLIKRKLVIREKGSSEIKEFSFDNALVRVSSGSAEVYLGVESMLSPKANLDDTK